MVYPVRPVGGEEVRRGAEVAARHAERGPDVLLDVGLVGVAGDRLDDAREIDEGRVAVAVPRARGEQQLLVRHHGHELFPPGRLERLPRGATAVGPRGILEARRVRQQHADGDVVHRPVRIVNLAQLGHPGGDLVIERQLAPVAELHDGDRRQGLGDRCPVVDGALIHLLPAVPVGQSELEMPHHRSIPHQHGAGSDHRLAGHEGLERSGKGGPARSRGFAGRAGPGRVTGRAGRGKGGARARRARKGAKQGRVKGAESGVFGVTVVLGRALK